MNKPIEIDSYEPDYHSKCDVCGATPIVTAAKDGKVVQDFGMCGACTFGSAGAVDPDSW